MEPASHTADLTVVMGAGNHSGPGRLALLVSQVLGSEPFIQRGIHRTSLSFA